MAFYQDPPRLGDTYAADPLLQEHLARTVPPDARREVEPELAELGRLAGGPLLDLVAADRLNEPRLVQWDPWGRRVDRIELTPLWREAAVMSRPSVAAHTAPRRAA